jgi:hypothetical protein
MLRKAHIYKDYKISGFSRGLLSAAALILVGCSETSSSPSPSPSPVPVPVPVTAPDPGTPTTLVNSANGMSPYACAVNGMCLNPAFALIPDSPLPANTQFAQSTYPWVDQFKNTLVISDIPYVSGNINPTDIDPAGFNLTVTEITSTNTAGVSTPYRYFKGNGLPNFVMGKFPVQSGTPAYPYYNALPGGSNEYPTADLIPISTYNMESYIPKIPIENPKDASGKVIPGPISSLITGISLYGAVWHAELANSSTSWYNPAAALPLDQCWGHPYNKQYHLHGYSWKCFPNQGNAGPSPLFGYALDGYGIYGPRGEDGQMITNRQLDECHGHTAPVMWDGKMTNIYHYHLNREYPYSIGCFHGVVDYAKALPNNDMTEGANYSAILELVPDKNKEIPESTIAQFIKFLSQVITKTLR